MSPRTTDHLSRNPKQQAALSIAGWPTALRHPVLSNEFVVYHLTSAEQPVSNPWRPEHRRSVCDNFLTTGVHTETATPTQARRRVTRNTKESKHDAMGKTCNEGATLQTRKCFHRRRHVMAIGGSNVVTMHGFTGELLPTVAMLTWFPGVPVDWWRMQPCYQLSPSWRLETSHHQGEQGDVITQSPTYRLETFRGTCAEGWSSNRDHTSTTATKHEPWVTPKEVAQRQSPR